ncbi:chromatin assembly factor 1 subunit A [Stomoxys calcitrans]|uniref:chromatin assembly factor 1 subunit A n=1 Tax=Stomoxys calcitrans TaxID=35570 RepID=UPI0027E21F36|nr:chromatin assembly factor 1 subunit A [Stomoxys calcitrans]
MMRNSTGGTTSSAKKSQSLAPSNDEKNSAKKLVQARLPFKIIAPGSSPSVDTSDTLTAKEGDARKEGKTSKQTGPKDTKETRKRKLSYESENDVQDDPEPENVSKENVEVVAAAVKKKKITVTSSSEVEVVSLLDDDEDDVVKANTSKTEKEKLKTKETTLKTPKVATKGKNKGAGTPQTNSSSSKKDTNKLQIKLPLSGGKRNKRRKSKANTSSHNISEQNNSITDSSDDIEEVSSELNPQKRTKLEFEEEEKATKKNGDTVSIDTEEISVVAANQEKDTESQGEPSVAKEKSETKNTAKVDFEKSDGDKEQHKTVDNNSTAEHDAKDENAKHIEEPNESIVIASDEEDINGDDADDENENHVSSKNANVSSDISEDSKSKGNSTLDSVKRSDNLSAKDKNLTPKQKKLLEQRQKAREEKERKLQEERRKKQQEKEEKELAKKREREEKEEQKRKEREEKEEQRRQEKEEKERKRLAEVEAKNEEKRKRNEAKEEETRKKDEERKRKEQEKEEAELKKKKAAEAFTKFFVAKTPSHAQQNIEEDEMSGDGTKALAFRPFQIKGDMKLAPINRKFLTEDAKCRLDVLLELEAAKSTKVEKSQLYLSELRSGQILPGKWRRPSTESKDDVILIEDELERVGEAIVEDTPAYIREEMRVKFYKFHDNRRPPYYGTWRKKSTVVTPRRPFAQDKKTFDYEVDSDDDWEEEEPGESLEDGSDDDKEKESEDEDYEVDNEWFVPHGHLSDEEMQNEDELGDGDANTREAQKAKLQLLQKEFAQEMKKKTEKIKPRLIGCLWVDASGSQPNSCPKMIWDILNTRSMLCTVPPILEEPEVEEPSSPSASNSGANAEKSNTDKVKPITITDAMLKDLARLLHGNNNSKNFLIKEYIAFIEKTEESIKNGASTNPSKTFVREKIDQMAEWQIVNSDAVSVDQATNNDEPKESAKKKKKSKKRLCWVVNQETLDKLDMSSLCLQNSWEYILTPKLKLDKESAKCDEPTPSVTTEPTATDSNSKTTDDNSLDKANRDTKSQITKFTKVLTAEEKANQLEKLSSSNQVTTPKSSSKNSKKSTDSQTKSPATNKEKKRVPLLMSVGRGQQISTPAKNKLISQFLQKGNNNIKRSSNSASKTNASSPPTVVDDDVVIID